jgi:hypothetical protein
VSHNPFDDFEFSEWVDSSLQLLSTSQASSESSTNQVNWPHSIDTSFNHVLSLPGAPPNRATEFSFDNFPCTESFAISDNVLHLASTPLPANIEFSMGTTTPGIYHATSHILDRTLADQNLPLGLEMSRDHSHETWARQFSPVSGLNDQTSSTSPTSGSTNSPTSSVEPRSRAKRMLAADATLENDRSEKRRKNNLAAAKYRQKKTDRIEELEKQLETVCGERDELKIMLAKRDTEVEILRSMLAAKGVSPP